jgi:hypothetical protein
MHHDQVDVRAFRNVDCTSLGFNTNLGALGIATVDAPVATLVAAKQFGWNDVESGAATISAVALMIATGTSSDLYTVTVDYQDGCYSTIVNCPAGNSGGDTTESTLVELDGRPVQKLTFVAQ